MSNDDLIKRGDAIRALHTNLLDDDDTRRASRWAINRISAIKAVVAAAEKTKKPRREPCPIVCDCICHDISGGNAHPNEPCKGKSK